jgi:hypothetical protein
LFYVRTSGNGISSIVMGRQKLEVVRNLTDVLAADAKCNELNEVAEEWRVELQTRALGVGT